MEKSSIHTFTLMGLSMAFLTLSKVLPNVPFLAFAGIAPLFVLFEQKSNDPSRYYMPLRIFIVLMVTFISWTFKHPINDWSDWLMPVLYAAATSTPFIIFAFTNKYAQNRIGFFTIVIYWLAIEFIAFWLNPEFAKYFFASVFNDYPELMSWNIYTGFMGVSLWILFVNVLLYHALFKNDRIFVGKIHWVGLLFSLLIACLPLIIPVDEPAIIYNDLQHGTAYLKQRSGSGEYIGKTAVWISVLLLLYSFVRREVNT